MGDNQNGCEKAVYLTITWFLLAILLMPSMGMASEKGKLAGLLVEYADLKQRVQHMRATHQSPDLSDFPETLALYKDLSEAGMRVTQFFKGERNADQKTRETIAKLTIAYDAMQQLVSAELNRDLQYSEIGMQVAGKYEEIWKLVDSSIPAVKIR